MALDIILRSFSGQRRAAHAPVEAVADEESQAALRQLTLERIMAYGVHHADAVELRGRVWSGEPWQAVAEDLAETCLSPPEAVLAAETPRTRMNRLFRASALVRMSQMMMVRNGPERSAIFARAGQLYAQAAEIAGDRSRMVIETPAGTLVGWLHPSQVAETVGRAVVIGGVEGWAMDFADLGAALARRGVETLMLDGPGQGESRMVHGHFLQLGWEASYAAVFEALGRRGPSLPLGFVGNSMGGAVAMHLAGRDPRIAACCNNGGGPKPGRPRGNTTFAQKMAAHVGDMSPDEASGVWKSIAPADPEHPVRCPLLVVHGGKDPMIAREDADAMLAAGTAQDRQMVVFDDGDHCVYNHADDKHALIGDWMASRLAAAWA